MQRKWLCALPGSGTTMKSTACWAKMRRKVLFPAAMLPSIAMRIVFVSWAASAAADLGAGACACDCDRAGKDFAGDAAAMVETSSKWSQQGQLKTIVYEFLVRAGPICWTSQLSHFTGMAVTAASVAVTPHTSGISLSRLPALCRQTSSTLRRQSYRHNVAPRLANGVWACGVVGSRGCVCRQPARAMQACALAVAQAAGSVVCTRPQTPLCLSHNAWVGEAHMLLHGAAQAALGKA